MKSKINISVANDLIKEEQRYWKLKIDEDFTKTMLPFKGKRHSNNIKEKKYYINNDISNNILKICNDSNENIFAYMYAAAIILLFKYDNNKKIAIETNILKQENILNIINTRIPLVQEVNRELTFREIIIQAKTTISEAYEYANYPINKIYDIFSSEIDKMESPLTDMLLVSKELHQELNDEELLGKIKITILLEEKTLCLSIRFDEGLYSEYYIDKLVSHFNNILISINNNINVKLGDIDFLGGDEEHKVLLEFNNTETDYQRDKTIVDSFQEQVERTPDNIAVIFKGKELTYRELNERSNSLAMSLRMQGVGPESIVGLMVERSIEMIVCIIAILKAGGAYLPIDTEYPESRVSYMLKDSKAKLLLANKKLEHNIQFQCQVIYIEDKEIYSENTINLNSSINRENLAYVIYTSGTTGRPKGVMVEHKGIINLKHWYEKKLGIGKDERILQFASVAFDAFSWELYMALLLGNTLCIPTKDIIMNSDLLNKYLADTNITTLTVPPFIASDIKPSIFLRRLITAGSEVKIEQVKNLLDKIEVINAYGPTEDTICTTYYRVKDTNIKIGKPIDNHSVLILDNHNELLPIGIPGELCVSGDGLARGYLNNEELTNKKFICNPFKPDTKMYKTGDLVRWLPDGNIEFLGRIDHQVKIRGFRIELGEIETKLLEIESIKEAVVIDKERSGSKYLCAYYVAQKEFTVGELRGKLKKSLPDYMIPSYFIKLDKIPLTSNGKVDRKLLLSREEKIQTGGVYEAPRNEAEERLVEIWQDILGERKIGINDNFFELGGHSLKATILINRIHKELNVEIPLKIVFDSGNIKGISEYIRTSYKKEYKGIERVEEKEYYEASSAQKRMYILQEVNKDSVAYNMPGVLEIIGKLDILRLKESFMELIKRHETLRTSFHSIGDKIVQKINSYEELYFEIGETSISSEEEIEEKIKDFIKPFNLETWPLLRVGILNLEEGRHFMLCDMHHIISDGTSMAILNKEFSRLYDGKELDKLNIQYKDYSNWQIKKRESEEFKKQEEFWLKEFSGSIPVLNMPTDYERPKVKDFSGDSISFVFNEELTKGLREVAKETGSTMYMVLLTSITILLSKYSGQEDIIIGSPIAGRNHRELENIIGIFVNTLAIRTIVHSELSYNENLKLVKEKVLKVYENQEYQFEELVEKVDVYRDLSRNPLFDVMFIHQNMEEYKIKVEDLIFKSYNSSYNTEKMDFTITSKEVGEEIHFELSYSTQLYKDATIESMINHFYKIVKEIVKNTNIDVKDIDIIGDEEKHKLLMEFNNTEVDYLKDKTIVDLFEEQVEKEPNNIAVVCDGKKLTYKELNEKSNGLARILREEGIKPDNVVGIIVERSLDMIISIMGVLKSGGAYLPFDEKTPKERVLHVLRHSNCEMLISHTQLSEDLKYDGKIVNIDELENINLAKNLDKTISSNNLAYVIYTSGTTGNSKGVMIEHRQVNNLIEGIIERTNINKAKVILCMAAISFDMSKLETLFPLANGMTIVIAKKDEAIDASAVEKLIVENGVEIIQTTPSRMKLLMENSTFKKALEQIKFVLVGGEQMPSNLAEEIIKFNNLEFYNMYGPTETTVWSTAKKVENKDLTIGKPIQNTKVYILDKDLNILPIGIVGELCISGDGVGRGYLNNEELTNEKFIDNPFEHGKKLYKTGDLARWRSDGEIDFIGRVDHQVKIRGYRIELSEIESKLLEITGIKEAVVIDKINGDSKYLCAYYVSNKEYTVGELREELKKTLPEYMLPSYFVNMDVLPLNNNGKIDRKSLPEIQGKINTGTEYEAPENEIEASMVEICKEVLGLQHLGVRDNLFEVGSNSITVVKICNKLKENNINISIKDIFYYENIRDIYRKCVYKEEAAADEELEDNNDIINLNISEIRQNLMEQINRFNNTILQQNIVETYCTSAIQKMSKEANITFSAVVMDFDYKVNIGLLKKSIVSVINTQSLLRSIIINFEDKMKIQEHEKVADIKIPYLNLEKVNESKRENIIEYIINEFYGENLQNEQSLFDKILYKIIIVKFSDKKYKLYMPFNHLIFDGMSNEIIKVNILRAYSNNGILKEDNSLGYHEYVNQLMEGPREVTEKEIMEKFNLDNFREGYKEYFHKLSNTKLINATISIELSEDAKAFIREMQWEVSLRVFLKILEINFELEKIPFVLINPGRSYAGKNYYNIIGEFVDVLPLSVKRGERITFDYVKDLLNFVQDKNINFITLISNDKFKVKYKNISNALKDMYSKQLNIPIFNYIELYDLDLEIDELTAVKDANRRNEISTEISIRLKENELIIGLFCEEQKVSNIKEELKNYFSTYDDIIAGKTR